jgi:maltooligosyltrehalose trehalohydrolase
MEQTQRPRRLPVGAEVQPVGGAHFRVWAPRRQRVDVVLERGPSPGQSEVVTIPLAAEGNGYFAGVAPMARAGMRYRYRLDGGDAYPDPASRFQPQGPHGPSQLLDPGAFRWTDQGWRGVPLHGQVIYELHVGTFTPEGTWEAAERQLPELAGAGITVLEVMPVAAFPGRFGWGYDGVDLFAPTHLYGQPDDFRRFVDRAHAAGLGVLLDVVYNHLGPDGNYLKQFTPDYFSTKHATEWGEAINYDGANAGPVREFFASNAGYWIDEYHLDGLRLDATHSIFDDSPEHILAAVSRRVRAAAGGRATLLVAENEYQHAKLVRPLDRGGDGLDAVWNDDFHHTALVALVGHNEAYYADYLGSPQELVSAVKWGYLYQGQRSSWQRKRRGTPAFDLPPAAFVNCLQNHDQVANSGRGRRPHQLTSPGRYRALTALLLLGPATPLLFQGQEFAASSPFLYFADHNPELARLVRQGRATFLKQFPSLSAPDMQKCLADPDSEQTFQRCKLDFAERQRHQEVYQMHRDLLRLRREDPVFRAQRPGGVDGAVLGPEAFVLRFFGADGDDRLLLVNLGLDLHLDRAPEPLLAPPEGRTWEAYWASESACYGGDGVAPLETEANWRIPGHAAVVLKPATQARSASEG